MHLKHIWRLWHNIWCCEVEPLFCRGVGEMEGTYESRVKKYKAEMHYTRASWEQTLVTVQDGAITLKASAWKRRSFPLPAVLSEMHSAYFTKLLFVGSQSRWDTFSGHIILQLAQQLQPNSVQLPLPLLWSNMR